MESGDPVAVHPNPGSDQEHGGAGRAENVGEDSAYRQKHHVAKRGGFPGHAQMDSAGDNIQGADQGHEADIFLKGVVQGRHFPPSDEVVDKNNRGHADAEDVVPLMPELRGRERADRNRPQKDDERG